MKAVEVLGVRIDDKTKAEINDFIKSGFGQVCKINPEFIVRAQNDLKFKEILNSAQLNVCDGVGVQWAAKFLGLRTVKTPVLKSIHVALQAFLTLPAIVILPKSIEKPLTNKFPGVDLFHLMLAEIEKLGLPVYFFGAEEEVLVDSVSKIKESYPKIEIVGFRNGYNFKDKEVKEDIDKSKAEILFVALGSPEQEKWIAENLPLLKSVRIAVGEGGTFDFVAGSYKRAPRLFRTLGVEWFWRLLTSKSKTPKTGSRAKRVFSGVFGFIARVIIFKLKK